jgi:hypothetical protein
VQLPCPLYPRKRTCAVQLGMSVKAKSRHEHFLIQPKLGSSLSEERSVRQLVSLVRLICFSDLAVITNRPWMERQK